MNWFEQLGTFYQVVLIIACVATVVMIIQLLMLLIGFGGGSDVDCTDCGDINCDGGVNDGGVLDIFGLKVLTVRNLFVFLSMTGWAMILVNELSSNYPLSITIGLLIGVASVFLCSYAMKKATDLQSEGNVDNNNALGKIGTCYLAIPGEHRGTGKVTVLIQNRLVEAEAITDEEEGIRTGEEVKVIDVKDTVLVVVRNK